jgi:secreted trypsin-like serine protease
MKAFVLILNFLFICKHTFASQRIYGGYQIDISEAPYIVHVTYVNQIFPNGSATTLNCGGSILRKNLILTAGHCE